MNKAIKKTKRANSLPNQVKERRKQLGKSQEWLAKQAGLSRVYISEIEREKRKQIGLIPAKRIAKALGRFVEELFP